MRVTGTIRRYIREEIRKKITPKYQEEKDRLQEREDLRDKIETMAKQAAFEAYNKSIDANFSLIQDFCEDHRATNLKDFCSTFLYGTKLPFKKDKDWQMRISMEIDREINKEVDNIVVALELGGNKEDLDKMLAEIGK